jgi:hypothetical protein
MDMKYNINKVHGSLISSFEDVRILENSNKIFGNYFEISAQSDGKEVRFIIEKKDIECDVFKWAYYSNPLNGNSTLIERKSSISSIVDDVRDIIFKNRFDEDYLSHINKL